MVRNKFKKIGDPYEKGDQVWIMNLGGKNRAGFFEKSRGKKEAYIRINQTGQAGWWVSMEMLQHRFPEDGVEGDVLFSSPKPQVTNGVDVSPLSKENLRTA